MEDFVIEDNCILKKYTGTASEVIIPEGITEIDGECFSGCNTVEKIILPASLESVTVRAFVGCLSVKEFIVSEDNNDFKCVNGDLYSKDGQMLIRYAVGKKAKRFDIPSEVTDTLRYVWYDAFRDSPYLECINLESWTLNFIENRAFMECKNLKKVILPYYLHKLGAFAFYSCNSLQHVNMGGAGCLEIIERATFLGCTSLKRIKLPYLLRYIEDEAFYRCENLESINLPHGLLRIGRESFCDCINLKSAYFHRGLLSIGESAFYNCSSLDRITLPDTLYLIERRAFYLCNNLSLKIHTLCLEQIGEEAIADLTNVDYIEYYG